MKSSFGYASVLRKVAWRDLVILVDNGCAPASDYLALAREMNGQAHAYPNGFGVIVVLPPLTTPPEPAVRLAIRDAYALVRSELRAVTWLIEGTEFRAAAVRAAVAGLRLLIRAPFPTSVASSYEEAVPFVLSKLSSRHGVDPRAAIAAIKREIEQTAHAQPHA